MKKFRIRTRTSIEVNESAEGQRIEDVVERLLNNNEPLPADAPLIYTERNNNEVLPEYDITTDRHEIVLDAMNVVEKTTKFKRKDAVKEREKALEELKNKETGGQSIDGTKETK